MTDAQLLRVLSSAHTEAIVNLEHILRRYENGVAMLDRRTGAGTACVVVIAAFDEAIKVLRKARADTQGEPACR